MAYLMVILSAVIILILYFIFSIWLKVKLRYGIAGMFLLVTPHTLGIVRPIDSETHIVILGLTIIGVILLAADIAKQLMKG